MNDDALALAQTIDDGAGRATLIPERANITLQNSVLPKVELIDGMPQFVSATRPRFVLEERLGQGGVGEVVRARDEDIGRTVAIKRLLAASDSQTSVARFVDEMRVTGSLDHPNVVPVHDVGVDPDGAYFFVMRHVRGETLEQIITRLAADDVETHRRYSVERRVEIFKSVLEAIAYAHSRGIAHRDIKPANIMVGPYGEVVMMDWGIAKPIARTEDLATLGDAPPASEDEGLARAFTTQAGAIVGTPAYMAPEQVRGLPVDERTDVYSLGVVLNELLWLEHYLAGKQRLVEVCNAVVHETPKLGLQTKSKNQPGVPAELYWFTLKAMEKDPAKRFQSVAEMIDVLERRANGDIEVQCPVTATRRLMYRLLRLIDRHPHTFVAGLALTVLLPVAMVIVLLVT